MSNKSIISKSSPNTSQTSSPIGSRKATHCKKIKWAPDVPTDENVNNNLVIENGLSKGESENNKLQVDLYALLQEKEQTSEDLKVEQSTIRKYQQEIQQLKEALILKETEAKTLRQQNVIHMQDLFKQIELLQSQIDYINKQKEQIQAHCRSLELKMVQDQGIQDKLAASEKLIEEKTSNALLQEYISVLERDYEKWKKHVDANRKTWAVQLLLWVLCSLILLGLVLFGKDLQWLILTVL
jgi:hypothetical protein